MTMMSAKQVIAGLRSKNKELKDQLEAVKIHIEKLNRIDFYDPPFVEDWDKWWVEYKEILGAEE